jgi:hypothetical protein
MQGRAAPALRLLVFRVKPHGGLANGVINALPDSRNPNSPTRALKPSSRVVFFPLYALDPTLISLFSFFFFLFSFLSLLRSLIAP